jgi:hypothetical protein
MKQFNRLPENLEKVVSEFYQTIVSKINCFGLKNDSRTIWGENNGLKPSWIDKKFDEESYRSFLKSYGLIGICVLGCITRWLALCISVKLSA